MKNLKEVTERMCSVEEGIKQYIKVTANQTLDIKNNSYTPKKETKLYVYDPAKDPKELPINGDVTFSKYNTNKSMTQKSLESMQSNTTTKYMSVKEKIKTITDLNKKIPDIEFSDKDKEILRKLELEHEKNIKNNIASSAHSSITEVCEKEDVHMQINSTEKPKTKLSVRPKQCVSIGTKIFIYHTFLYRYEIGMCIYTIIFILQLSSNARERKVPSTRLQRMVSFGTLGIGLGLGTAAEYTRRTLGLKEQSIGDTVDSMFLTKANAERIVSTLCKVRGKVYVYIT